MLGDCGDGDMQYWTVGAAQLSFFRGGEANAKSTAPPVGFAMPSPPFQRFVMVGPGGATSEFRLVSLFSATGRVGEIASDSGRSSSSSSSSFVLSVAFAHVVDEFPPAGFPPVIVIIVVSATFTQAVSGTSKLFSP